MAWLTGWNKRKKHTILQQAGAGTNYQVAIKIYKGSGTDGTETFHDVLMGKMYCNNVCQDNFGDVRFTASDGETELDYWLHDDLSSGIYAVFWVKVSGDLTAGNVDIFVYYRTSEETDTTKNMMNTFLVAQDNQETTLGTVPAGWVETSVGICDARIRDDQFKYGDRSFKLNDDCDDGYASATISGKTLGSCCIVDLYMRMKDCDFYAACHLSDQNKAAMIFWDHGNENFCYLDGNTVYHTIETLSDNIWYHIQLYYNWVTERFMGCYIDGVWHGSNWTMRNQETWNIFLAADLDTGISAKLWNDCLFIRKWSGGDEPVHGTWTSSEGIPSVPTEIRACCVCV